MMKLSNKEFDRIAREALKRIPAEIREPLDNILITVKKRPSKSLLKKMGLRPGETLLGLYSGVSLMRRSITFPPLFPDTIFLFQEPIENQCNTREEIEEQIRVTLVHEVAHALGMGEGKLRELGYG